MFGVLNDNQLVGCAPMGDLTTKHPFWSNLRERWETVMNEPNENPEDIDIEEVYLRVWKSALGEFLGWTLERINQWATPFYGSMYEGSFLYHDAPLSFVANELVPKAIRSDSTQSPYHFRARIEDAITDGHMLCESDQDFDWTAARNRVELLLATVGSSLADIKREIEESDDPPNTEDLD